MTRTIRRVFGEGFRAFFLFALAQAVLAAALWGLWIGMDAAGRTLAGLPFGDDPADWHAHEMIFGYGSAAVAGFLLTAVPNWTGSPAMRRGFVTAVALLWLAGRAVVWLAPALPAGLVAAVDLAFLPVLIVMLAVRLVRRPKPQNVMFVLFLGLLWGADLAVQLEWMGLGSSAENGFRAGILTLSVMIAVIGGRVTPAFTRNAMKRAGVMQGWPRSRPWLDLPAVAGGLVVAAAALGGWSGTVPAAIALLAGLAQLGRVAGWRPGWALGQPILWSLHLGGTMLGLGLIAWGLAGFGLGGDIAALHVLGIGAIGGMTLAVMSRATLGHSGRPLIAPAPVALGYGLLPVATLLRWLAEDAADWRTALLTGAAALWVLAFALSLAALWPALSRPRPDRPDGAGG